MTDYDIDTIILFRDLMKCIHTATDFENACKTAHEVRGTHGNDQD